MAISSNSPVSTVNPDALPMQGYSKEQLTSYIERQLGAPTWSVELSKTQIADCINDALAQVSIYIPMLKYGAIRLLANQNEYLRGVDVGMGVVNVDFVEPNPVPTEIFYGNLIDPAPLFRTGLDEYDTFLRWRKTWMRVTSVRPDFLYDEIRGVLMIHNPLERFFCGITCHMPRTTTESLNYFTAQWVKDYSLEKARYLLGEIYAKFSGVLPMAGGNATLDQQKRANAEARLEKLLQKLKDAQLAPPIQID